MHRLLSLALGLGLLQASTASATIFTVGSGAGCNFATVTEAVAAALTNGPATDTIRIARNRTYTAQHIVVQNQSVLMSGGFDSCTAVATTSPYTTLSGSGGSADSVIEILGSGDVVLLNLDIRDGDTTTSAHGGGIAASGGPHVVTLINVTVQSNRAGFGGGISVDANAPGAIQLNMDGNVLLIGNEATNGDGGGIYCQDSIVNYVVSNGRMINNTATRNGGGMRADNCTLRLSSGDPLGLFALNQAGESGGGLSIKGDSATATIYTAVADSPTRFFGNRALTGAGGAIEVRNGAQVSMFDTNLIGNSAPDGGAVSVYDNDASPNAFLRSNEGFRPQGSVYCNPSVPCSLIEGNAAKLQNGNASNGPSAISVNAESSGTASADIRRTTFTGNTGGALIASGGSVKLGTIAAFGNTSTGSLIGGSGLDIADSSFGSNVIGNAQIILGLDTDTILRRIAAMQPGKKLVAHVGSGVIIGENLVANDLTGVPPTTNNLEADPQFISATNLRLQPTSVAIDYAAGLARDGFDLDGVLRPFDSPQVIDRFGPLDLGAYERSQSPSGSLPFADSFED